MAEQWRLTAPLNTITNIAILLVLVYATYAVWDARRSVAGNTRSNKLTADQRAEIAKLVEASASATAIVALSTSCEACAENVPLYRSLADLAARSEGRLNLVLAFPRSSTDAEKFVIVNKLSPVRIARIDFKIAGITQTPTLFMLDRNGKIRQVWFGRVPSEQRDAVLRAMRVS